MTFCVLVLITSSMHVCHLQTFMWFVLKFIQLPKLFHLNHWKLVIFSQLLKEFHTNIECWHGAPSTSGRTSITISSGYATNIPTFSNTSPSNPLIQQFFLVACTMVTKNDDDGEGSPFTLHWHQCKGVTNDGELRFPLFFCFHITTSTIETIAMVIIVVSTTKRKQW